MADILIRGMEMPGHCRSCPLRDNDDDHCVLQPASAETDTWEFQRKHCPLLHLPEWHGRLIDADVMVEGLMKCVKNPPDNDQESRWFYLFTAEIAKSCETIVPAEGGNADGN